MRSHEIERFAHHQDPVVEAGDEGTGERGIVDGGDEGRLGFGNDFGEWGVHDVLGEAVEGAPCVGAHEAGGESGAVEGSGGVGHDFAEVGGFGWDGVVPYPIVAALALG